MDNSVQQPGHTANIAIDVNALMGFGEEDDQTLTLTFMSTEFQTETKVYMCNLCNYTTGKRDELRHHMQSHYEERPHEPLVDERNSKTFGSLTSTGLMNTLTEEKLYQCESCPKFFTTAAHLIRHKKYKHSYDRPYKCNLCDYAGVENFKFKRHMEHHKRYKFKCLQCPVICIRACDLHAHIRMFHVPGQLIKCERCGGEFPDRDQYKIHCDSHDAETHQK